MSRDDRSAEAQAWRRLYNTARWKGKRGIRANQLASHPLCEMCLKAGRLTPATVCDHVDPASKATEEGFFAAAVQSLCAPCHDGRKQQIEGVGFSTEVDPSGMPLDPNHPFYR